MVSTHEAVISVFQIGLKGDNRLGCELLNLSLDMADVTAAGGQLLVYVTEQLFTGVVPAIHERGVWLLKLIRVFIQ